MKIIKKKYKFLLGIIICIIAIVTVSYADILYDSNDVKYNNSNTNLNSTNVQDVIDEIQKNITSTYTITFNGNGNTGGSTASKICNVKESCTLPTNGFIKEGYEFVGWSYSSNGEKVYSNQDIIEIVPGKANSNVNLYAKWEPINYTITYNLDGGMIMEYKISSYNVETESFTLPIPRNVSYTFFGWTGSNGNTPETTVTISKGSIGDKNYTAKWGILWKYNLKYSNVDGCGLTCAMICGRGAVPWSCVVSDTIEPTAPYLTEGEYCWCKK